MCVNIILQLKSYIFIYTQFGACTKKKKKNRIMLTTSSTTTFFAFGCSLMVRDVQRCFHIESNSHGGSSQFQHYYNGTDTNGGNLKSRGVFERWARQSCSSSIWAANSPHGKRGVANANLLHEYRSVWMHLYNERKRCESKDINYFIFLKEKLFSLYLYFVSFIFTIIVIIT